MKLSVSLTEEDIRVLDGYVQRAGLQSRSAGLQRAIRLLRYPSLEDDYRNAWKEWTSTGDADLWTQTTGDGAR